MIKTNHLIIGAALLALVILARQQSSRIKPNYQNGDWIGGLW